MATGETLGVEGRGFLDRLPASTRRAILVNSVSTNYRPSAFVYRPDDPGGVEILQSGLLRVFVSAPDGRQATIRYVHPGQVLGVLRLLAAPFSGSAHALVASVALRLDSEVFRRRAEADIALAGAIIDELALGYAHTAQTMSVQAFGSILQKVAFDLLERACRDQLETGRLEAAATHQDIADGTGSVRVVVGRALDKLRRAGLIDSSRRRIQILDPERLDQVAQTGVLL